MDQREARDEAISRVGSAAGNEWWRPYAMRAVYEAACLKREITSDDVWRVLHEHRIRDPKENRVMGPVMIVAQRKGWIEATDRTRISHDPASPNHSRPQRVYLSRILGKALPSWESPVNHAPPPGASSQSTNGRPFPLRRNDDGTIEIVTLTCSDCGDTYTSQREHMRTDGHREAVRKLGTIEEVVEIPPSEPQGAFIEQPKLVFGEMIPCPRCKGMRRKRKGRLSEVAMDPHNPSQVCPRCNGVGVVPNTGAIP